MVRAPLAGLVLAAGLGLAAGCTNCGDHPLFGRKGCSFSGPCECPCSPCSPCGPCGPCGPCESGCMGNGAVVGDGGPVMVPPQTSIGPVNPPPLNGVPQPSPTPRLVPQPQSQPTPYVPQSTPSKRRNRDYMPPDL